MRRRKGGYGGNGIDGDGASEKVVAGVARSLRDPIYWRPGIVPLEVNFPIIDLCCSFGIIVRSYGVWETLCLLFAPLFGSSSEFGDLTLDPKFKRWSNVFESLSGSELLRQWRGGA